MGNFIFASIGVFLVIILLLVVILLVAKAYLSPSGNVNITINGKDKFEVGQIEMSLQYSTYFLVRRRRKKKLWLTSIFLKARLCFHVVCIGKESGLGEGQKN